MAHKISSLFVPVLMLLNGLFFISNIYVLGNTQAAIKMHEDLAPWAGPVMAQTKVLVCFITGLMYVIAFAGFLRGLPNWILLGSAGAALFFGLYVIELIAWGRNHSPVWLGFAIFGSLSILFGIWCWVRGRAQLV